MDEETKNKTFNHVKDYKASTKPVCPAPCFGRISVKPVHCITHNEVEGSLFFLYRIISSLTQIAVVL